MLVVHCWERFQGRDCAAPPKEVKMGMAVVATCWNLLNLATYIARCSQSTPHTFPVY